MTNRIVSLTNRMLVLLCIMYVLARTDIIPDFLVLGWLDDAALIFYTAVTLMKSRNDQPPMGAVDANSSEGSPLSIPKG